MYLLDSWVISVWKRHTTERIALNDSPVFIKKIRYHFLDVYRKTGLSRDQTPQCLNKDNSFSITTKWNIQENMLVLSTSKNEAKWNITTSVDVKVTERIEIWKKKSDREQSYRGIFKGNHIAERWIKFKSILFFIGHFRNKTLFVCETKRTENQKVLNLTWLNSQENMNTAGRWYCNWDLIMFCREN